MEERPALLDIRNLSVSLGNSLRLVADVSFSVSVGEVVSIVGESGSGKSVTMRAAMGLSPRGSIVDGSIKLAGEELNGAPESRLKQIRGAGIGMIFQDPMTALNPVIRVGDLIAEAFLIHDRSHGRTAARRKAIELLQLVAVPQPEVRASQYVHEFSGGMRQRVMIAIAIANNPSVLIADEPTTALDVTVQAQIMDVLGGLLEKFPMGLALITHDLGVVAGVADRVVVMYAGRVVEQGPVRAVFYDSRHPYTRGLLACMPKLTGAREPLSAIPGNPPTVAERPTGCPFRPRCPMAKDICRESEPKLRTVGSVLTACHFAEDVDSLPLTRAH